MRDEPSEWVRLPGLFVWDEVCEVFAEEAGHDDAWRFSVVLDSLGPDDAPLYVVHAAPGSRFRDSSDADRDSTPADSRRI